MPAALIFLALPIVEIALFILVGGWIGLWATLALVIAAVFGGMALMRGAGVNAAQRIRVSMAQDNDPSGEIVRMAMTFVAGMLLFLPGFLTDAAALVLLVPQVQRAAFATLRRRAQLSGMVMGATMGGQMNGQPGGHPGRPAPPADRVIDGEFTEVSPTRPSRWTED